MTPLQNQNKKNSWGQQYQRDSQYQSTGLNSSVGFGSKPDHEASFGIKSHNEVIPKGLSFQNQGSNNVESHIKIQDEVDDQVIID